MAPTAWLSRWHVIFLATLALVASLIAVGPTRAAAADVVLDGSTEARAAVSCWEIKQIKPEAEDGRYWLLTPQMKAPTQFYCDMTTDGGGWVLVGRGRQGWSVAYNGRGTTDQVSETITGQAAFNPKQLDANVINSLFGGKRFDQVSPELRVRRAANGAGTAWQEVVMSVAQAERWTWAFQGGVALNNVKFDGVQRVGRTTTRNIQSNNGPLRLWMYSDAVNNWERGMHYGATVTGDASDSTYLYTSTGTYATPFAQMFIRPKLRKDDVTFDDIADSGTEKSTVPAVANNGVKTQEWGVSGTGQGGTGENGTEVQAFAQIGQRMFAGGNFTQVRKGENASGSDLINQRYLAAFDASSGDYVPGFTPPVLNGQVKALAALPNNRLAVGGEFTTVAGQPRAGLVVLDATSGAVDEAWTYAIENRLTGGDVSIRALDVSGDYLYLAGAMTHMKSGASQAYAKGAGRIQISTRTPDWYWTPEFNGTVAALDVSTDGSRVYYAGYFTTAQGAVAEKMAAFSTASGPAQRVGGTWTPTFSSSGARYQQAIKESGDKIWVGGAQHSLFSWDTETFALEDTHITHAGGDLQAIDEGDGYVYAGCHCENATFDGISNWDTQKWGNYNTGIATKYLDSIYFVGAWDAETGRYAPDFTAEMQARRGMGIWAIKIANDGTVWTGGSLTTAVNESGRNQWNGGFARFGIRDHEAPAKPSDLTASVVDGEATVNWSGASGAQAYEVLRNDRPVATVTATTATIPDSEDGDRFFVRAVDQGGNRSASTAVAEATVPAETTTLLDANQDWQYYSSNTAVSDAWKTPRFDDSAWSTGQAPLGWGSSRVNTTVPVPAGDRRPVVSYYRNSFTIPAGTTVGDVTLTTVADDGVAVYVNGTEIGRNNLPEGDVTRSTYATAAPRSDAAWQTPTTFTIPHEVLRQGKNTIAMSSHVMWRATPDGSIDAKVVAESGDFAPPAVAEKTTLVAEKATWDYLFSPTVAAPETWKTSADGTSEWKSGPAPLGWGTSGPITTNIDVPAGTQRGLTSYYRRTFDVADPSAITALRLTSRADDGIAIYINGEEVNRTRLPAGNLTAGTYATSAVSTAAALADPIAIDVPISLLNSGENTIAVEVHSNYRTTSNQSMAVELVATS